MGEAETPWYPQRGLLLWRLERRLWSNWSGSAYQWHRYKNGALRRFWTRAQAQQRADELNKETP
jgi:hypothetical protein